MSELFNINGKIALVTGGNDGMGRMIAHGLVRSGCKVYITSRHQDDGEKVAKQLTLMGPGTCICIQSNLGKEESCYQLADEFSKFEDHLHILINNAGKTSIDDNIEEEGRKESVWNMILSINLNTPFYLSRAFLPLLKKGATKENPARIINMSSISGIQVPSYDMNAYSVSKSGLNHLTKLMAKQLAPFNITVNAILPGPFKSRRVTENILESIVESVPLRRVGNQNDISGTVIFLCSEAGSFLTGTLLVLDGGLLIKSPM